eukprot:15157216-Heterocapsa_arctica.AAC.1
MVWRVSVLPRSRRATLIEVVMEAGKQNKVSVLPMCCRGVSRDGGLSFCGAEGRPQVVMEAVKQQ